MDMVDVDSVSLNVIGVDVRYGLPGNHIDTTGATRHTSSMASASTAVYVRPIHLFVDGYAIEPRKPIIAPTPRASASTFSGMPYMRYMHYMCRYMRTPEHTHSPWSGYPDPSLSNTVGPMPMLPAIQHSSNMPSSPASMPANPSILAHAHAPPGTSPLSRRQC